MLEFLLFTFLAAPAFSQSNIGLRNINFTSLQEEISLGRRLADKFELEVPILNDAQTNELLKRIAERITRNSDSPFPITVKLVNRRDFNAFSLPGGFIYVNAGVLLAAEDEAELASVVSYQIAHVAARHVTEMEAKFELIRQANIPLRPGEGIQMNSYRETVAGSVPPAFPKFVKKDIAEADFLGLQYLYKSGYDPAASVRMLQKAGPLEADRVNVIQRNLDMLPPLPQAVIEAAEFESVKKHLMEIEDR